MFDTVATSMHELFGLACSYLPAFGDAVVTTARAQAGQSTENAGRANRRERTTAILYLLQSAVETKPTREAVITISEADNAWIGEWSLTADAEPTPDGEWRCLCLNERTGHTIAAANGAKRPVRG